mgnify:CR=1 FL=1
MVHSEIHRSHPDKVQVSKKEDRDRGVYRGLTKKNESTQLCTDSKSH